MITTVKRGSASPRRRVSAAVIRLAGLTVSALGLFMGVAPHQAWACACGCGVFEVGTASMFPAGAGGMAWLEYDFQDQNHNWSGASQAPSSNNGDKELTTSFFTAGMQYMFSRSWGVEAEIPYWDRSFKTDLNFGSPPPDIVRTTWNQVGDVRLRGIYTGFSDDLSSGITFGVKLPTGNFQFNPAVVDRDSQVGSGSTDILLGAYHRANLTSDGMWAWFVQTQFDQPVFTQDGYRPGTELDTALGVLRMGWTFGDLTITPIGEAIVSLRTRDSGPNSAQPLASGFERLLLAPGVEFDYKDVAFYVDAEVPVLQNFTGNQLAAPVLFKAVFSVKF